MVAWDGGISAITGSVIGKKRRERLANVSADNLLFVFTKTYYVSSEMLNKPSGPVQAPWVMSVISLYYYYYY